MAWLFDGWLNFFERNDIGLEVITMANFPTETMVTESRPWSWITFACFPSPASGPYFPDQ